MQKCFVWNFYCLTKTKDLPNSGTYFNVYVSQNNDYLL